MVQYNILLLCIGWKYVNGNLEQNRINLLGKMFPTCRNVVLDLSNEGSPLPCACYQAGSTLWDWVSSRRSCHIAGGPSLPSPSLLSTLTHTTCSLTELKQKLFPQVGTSGCKLTCRFPFLETFQRKSIFLNSNIISCL